MTRATVSPEPAMIERLAGSDARPALVAMIEGGGHVLSVNAIGPIAVRACHSLELWALPDGKAPHSPGLLDAAGVVRIALPVPAVDAFQGVSGLAINLEPSGSSRTGAPTGPVLFSGRLERI